MSLSLNGPHFPRQEYGGGISERADADGVVRSRVAPGEITASVGSVPQDYPNADRTPPQTVTVQRGQKARLTFRFRKAIALEGIILGEDDNPIPGLHVRVLREWESYRFDSDPGSADRRDRKMETNRH